MTEIELLLRQVDENRCRKALTPREIHAYGKQLERLLGAHPEKTEQVESFHLPGKGKTRDRVGSALGISGKQYDKLKAIYDSHREDLHNELDQHGRVDRAYRKLQLRKQAKSVERKKQVESASNETPIKPGIGHTNRIYQCRLQDVAKVTGIDAETVKLIIAETPFSRGILSEIVDLGELATRVLSKEGILLIYSCNFHFPEILESFQTRLHYHWLSYTVCVGAKEKPRLRPLLCFSKAPANPRKISEDLRVVQKKGGDWFRLGEPLEEIADLIDYYTTQEDVILNPWKCGKFTTALAARGLNRRCISCDSDSEVVERGKRRLAQAQA